MSQSSTHTFTVTAGPDQGRSYSLRDGETQVIGRGPECGIRLSDPSVSREHCRLAAANGRVSLVDAGSRWGTLVNGQSIDRWIMQTGDVIEIGDSELRFDGPGDDTTVAPKGSMSPTA